MSEKKIVRRSVVIALATVFIILAVFLVGIFAHYASLVNDKDNTISSLNTQIATKDYQIALARANATSLQTQLNDLTRIVALNKSKVYYNTSALDFPYNQGLELPATFTTASVIGDYYLDGAPVFGTYMGVALVQVSSNYDTYVNVTYSSLGYDFYDKRHVGMNGTAAFVILPSNSGIFITVYTHDVIVGATAIITITYIY